MSRGTVSKAQKTVPLESENPVTDLFLKDPVLAGDG